jgi:hypothetical protein
MLLLRSSLRPLTIIEYPCACDGNRKDTRTNTRSLKPDMRGNLFPVKEGNTSIPGFAGLANGLMGASSEAP